MLIAGEQFLQFSFGVEPHRAEFVHLEFLAVAPDARLGEEYGSAIFEFHHQCQQQIKRAERDEKRDAACDVECAFHHIAASDETAQKQTPPMRVPIQPTSFQICPGDWDMREPSGMGM
jgi:hypothetical protein